MATALASVPPAAEPLDIRWFRAGDRAACQRIAGRAAMSSYGAHMPSLRHVFHETTPLEPAEVRLVATVGGELGGFLRLSGTPESSVEGRSIALARLVMARKVGSLPFTLGGAMRAGFSLEVGGGYDHDDPIPQRSYKQAASAFLSVETRFGPAYLAAGATRGGDKSLYLFLGPIW